MVNYCDKCGHKIDLNDMFCSNCGAQVVPSKSSGTANIHISSGHRPRQLTTQSKLYRARDDRWIAGVCGGLGRHFNIDPILIRIGFILACFGWGAGLILYIILAFFIEEEPLDIEFAPSSKRQPPY